jgi:prephenate dehydrogenase
MRLAVIGTGLIGTSAALAGSRMPDWTICGWDANQDSLDAAAARGALKASASLADAVGAADAIIVAVPVGESVSTVSEVLAAASQEALVTDVGSTKSLVVDAIEDPRFVGGHPMAGGETAGPANARADLFEGATWYLTPRESTAGIQLDLAFRIVSEFGARPRTVRADAHDRILATVSHLPHVFANLLVGEAASMLASEDEPLRAVGPSFRDAVRVAGSPSSIWTDIYLANAERLVQRLASVETTLAEVRAMLESGDRDGLTAWNDIAAAQRAKLISESNALGPAAALEVSVENRPGVLAGIALALADAGIDVADLQLQPAADRASGTIVLWIEGESARVRAAQLIGELGHGVSPR